MASPSRPDSPAPGEVRIPQQARSRRTRARILDAATRAFEELGYDDATTAAIAQLAGVAVGSVYSYFADKRSILLEILQETLDQMRREIIAGQAPDLWRHGDLRLKVRALVETTLKTRRFQPGLQRILWERYFKDPLVRDAIEAIERPLIDAIEQLLEVLREEGLSDVADVSSASFVIHTSVEWIAARLVLGEAPQEKVDAAVDTTSAMISRLILSEAPGFSQGLT